MSCHVFICFQVLASGCGVLFILLYIVIINCFYAIKIYINHCFFNLLCSTLYIYLMIILKTNMFFSFFICQKLCREKKEERDKNNTTSVLNYKTLLKRKKIVTFYKNSFGISKYINHFFYQYTLIYFASFSSINNKF